MAGTRLIVNGDDFGLTKGINRGILESARYGILTSTSVMVKRPYAHEIVDFNKIVPHIGIGLHVDFSEELLKKAKSDGNITSQEIEAEIEYQIILFKNIAGFMPDHLDFHKIAVRTTNAFVTSEIKLFRPPVENISKKYSLPWRGMDNLVVIEGFHAAVYDKATHKKLDSDLKKISTEGLIHLLTNLSEGDFEMFSHPGYVDDEMTSSYKSERELEINTLTDPNVKEVIEKLGIKLISYNEL